MTSTAEVGRKAEGSDWLDGLIRFGLVAYGVVHLLLAWVALQLAFGHRSQQASPQGAMHELADRPLGGVLVWAIGIGMFCLVAWRLLEAVAGHRDSTGAELWRRRALSLGRAVVYGAIGSSAIGIALGGGGSGNQQSRSVTARVLDMPAGTWLVAAAGLVIIGFGLAHVRTGFGDGCREKLSAEGRSGETGTAYLALGRAGYVAKGLVICSVGGLVGYAALSHDPQRSGGLDAALRTVLEQPYGPALLTVLAAGLACFGLFCLARARHLSA